MTKMAKEFKEFITRGNVIELACAVVLVLYWRSERRGLTVAGAIACFQFCLLVYLSFK